MAIKGKHIAVGALAVVSVALAAAYWQYTKLKEYAIKFKGVRIKKVSLDNADVDLFLEVANNSDIKINLISQEYKVFVNGTQVSTISNNISQTLEPKKASVVAVNMVFSPKKVINILGTSYTDLLTKRENIKIKYEVKLKVGIWGVKVANIPFTYDTNLKELMTPTPSVKD